MNVFKLIEDNGLQLHGDIEYFAHLVAEVEREACAKVCEQMSWPGRSDEALWKDDASDECAAAIRARGEK